MDIDKNLFAIIMNVKYIHKNVYEYSGTLGIGSLKL